MHSGQFVMTALSKWRVRYSRDPLQRFPVRPSPESAGHPILDGISDFDLAEEVWAQNVVPGARYLSSRTLGTGSELARDLREPIPVAACTVVDQGRVAFFSLGHFPETYEDSGVLRFFANAINWLAKRTPEQCHLYHVFLSYSSANKDRALRFAEVVEAGGLRIFRDEVEIRSGDKWEESIPQSAPRNSRELAILATPDSLSSEWVQTEWERRGRSKSTLHRFCIDATSANCRKGSDVMRRSTSMASRFVGDVRSRRVA